jgi:hypothetical protein
MKPELKALKARLGHELSASENDELLTALLYEAENDILAYTRRDRQEWLPVFDAYLIKLAAFLYQNAGNEGIKSRREGDITTDFADGPEGAEKLLKPLSQYRKAVVP